MDHPETAFIDLGFNMKSMGKFWTLQRHKASLRKQFKAKLDAWQTRFISHSIRLCRGKRLNEGCSSENMPFFARMRRIIKTHLGSTDKPSIYTMTTNIKIDIYIYIKYFDMFFLKPLKPKGFLTILFPNQTDGYSWYPMGLIKVLMVLPLETALHDPQTGARRLKASATSSSTTWRHSLGDRSWTAGMFTHRTR